jgi:glycosyltransferase involved in cell wall biosynthesis
VKLGIVVQRYGADINGGAELHARYIAERLARHASVEVITTCAVDYVTWRNELPAGLEEINGVPVRRFPVDHERDPLAFGLLSQRVFEQTHSVAHELAWLEAEGPASRQMIAHAASGAFDYLLFFSYRYHHAWHGVRRLHDRAILVPTAERDPAIGLSIFPPIFRAARAIMYNSPEERAMIQAAARNEEVPGVVVGVGSEVPERADAARFRRKFRLERPFAIYVGRIDENKGCAELFEYYQRYATSFPNGLDLVLIGRAIIPVPADPRIHHLGFLPDPDKFDALAAADLLIMPSYFESLSMVALEAWALGRPVLANGRCDVLRGQCIRSGAGLYYDNYPEFVEALYALESPGPLNAVLGRNGRQFFREHYAWPVIERKYLEMLERLRAEEGGGGRRRSLEKLPGWWARRRHNVPPAASVVAGLPSGAVVGEPRTAGPGRPWPRSA